jgi:hypothetical protein
MLIILLASWVASAGSHAAPTLRTSNCCLPFTEVLSTAQQQLEQAATAAALP